MTVRFKIEASVATITLARPEKRNALSIEMRQDMIGYFEKAAADPEVRAVLLNAEGPGFCAGGDVDRMGDLTMLDSRRRMQFLHRMILALYNIDKPVISAVRGACVGVGWSLALASDLVVASPTARFAQVFRRIGLAPDGGAIYFLSRALGWPRTKELVFSGRMLEAQEALQMGLLHSVVPDEDLDAAALRLASEMAEGPTYALGLSKRLFDAATAPSLEEFLKSEQLVQPLLSQSADHLEGVAAFRAKRNPKFIGS